MMHAGVVLDGAGLALHAARAHGEHGVELVTRENFFNDTVTNILFIKYYVLAATTLLYFDHVITLPLEIRRVWCTRFTGASLLFLLNRYIPFFGYIPVILSLFNPPWNINVSSGLCKRFAPYVGVLGLFSNVISAIILILRTYALYSRALWVLIVTGTFGAASVAISGWSASSVQGELFNFQPLSACVPMLIRDSSLKFAWIMTFVFDFVVFGLTIARTYRFMRAQARLQMQSNLTMLLVRDGSIYFLVMSTVNAVNFIFSIKLQNSFFASATGTNSILANVISVTMISRLLLNLREESVQYNRRSSGGDAQVSTVQTLTDTNLIFTSRIFGNLTADLDYGSPGSSRVRRGSENYYSYDYGGEDSDELYELQSRSTRSGFTARSGYSGRTVSTDPGSSSGTGTIAGSSSGSGSGSGSGAGRGKDKSGRRGHSRLAWAASVNTASSSATGRAWLDEPQSPPTAVETRVGLLASGDRSPQLLTPLSPTLNQPSPSPLSPYPLSPLSRGTGREDDHDANRGEEWEWDWDRGQGSERERPRERASHLHMPGPDEAIEMSNLERRARPEGSHAHDLYHDHYRPAPSSRPESRSVS